MTDAVGKVFVMEAGFGRCLICSVLFTLAASRVHSLERCSPAPLDLACLPNRYGVVEGTA
jgi:hypothetical protein